MKLIDEDFIEGATKRFLEKTGMTRPEFDALDAKMRTRAFTVAYCESVDQVNAIQKILGEALAKGMILDDFQKAVSTHIDSKPWHIETVLRTNVQSTYGAAKWEIAQQLRSLRPYGRYSAVMDGRTRPAHAELHGRVWPIDHPIWQTIWPPWDYNCRCHVRTITQYELERDGLQVETTMPGILPENDFVSPAVRGIEIKPLELLGKRISDMLPMQYLSASQKLMSEVDNINQSGDQNALQETT